MNNLYKASLTNIDNKINKQFDSCLLTVSVGQAVHEGEKFKATLELVNNKFKKCTIAVCDTLQRHSLALMANLGSKDLNFVAKKDGDQWIERNLDYCDYFLKIPYNIKRWDAWLFSEEYLFYRKQVDKLFQEDNQFIDIVHSLARYFNNRLFKRGHIVNFDNGIKFSIEYLLEECAAMCQWYNEGYSIEIYPSIRNEAIEYCFSKIMTKHYNNLLLPAGISFKKNEALNFNTSIDAMKKILNIIPGHIYWKDLEGRFLGCNQQQAENYGFKNSKALIGKKDSDFLKAEIANEITANDQKIIVCKKEQIIEEDTYINQGKKRIKRTFLSHKIPMINDNDETIGIIGVSLDISEQKKLQQILLNKTEELSIALAHKKDFLNVLSHEIRTPLHVTSSIIDELHKNIHSFSKEEINSFIVMLAENNKRLMKLLTHLLDSAKNLKGETTYHFKEVNIIDVCLSCIKEFSFLANIKFINNASETLYVQCDEIKISQVIRNLLDNAVKYGLNKEINLYIDTITDPKNIIIKVENFSTNFQKDEEQKLFDMFFQGEIAKKMQNGVGLGLAICREIVNAHKGKIWAGNVDEEHVHFSFSMPNANLNLK